MKHHDHAPPDDSSAWKGSLMDRFREMPPAELEMLFIDLCSPASNLATTPRQLVSVLSKLVQDESMRKMIVDCGAIPAFVRHLRAPPEGQYGAPPPVGLVVEAFDFYVEAVSAHALSILAINTLGYQKLIMEAGALLPLVDLLKRTHDGLNSPYRTFLLRGVICAIDRLAFVNSGIKTLVRVEGGIPPLVKLLWSVDEGVRRVAVWALVSLAKENDGNKNQIMNNNDILDRLIMMLRSKDPHEQGGAVSMIAILVESYPDIRSHVVDGALQLVIGLLSSSSARTQKKAAELLRLFADTYSDCKVHIAQRGAIPPLIQMLHSADAQTRKVSASTLCQLAEDTHNLLVQNEDTVGEFIEMGGFQKLQDGEFEHQ